MANYSSDAFANALTQKLTNRNMPTCRFCGGTQYIAERSFTSLSQQDAMDAIVIGTSIPAGTVVCANCGHVELFALGVLGLLPKKGVGNNGNEKNSCEKE